VRPRSNRLRKQEGGHQQFGRIIIGLTLDPTFCDDLSLDAA
jgi:hypothetical protein